MATNGRGNNSRTAVKRLFGNNNGARRRRFRQRRDVMNEWSPVPPPETIAADPNAERLGLPRGLEAVTSHDQYRCYNCRKMQPRGSVVVYVPDSVLEGDPAWSVTEAARLNAYNGSGSGWCVKCAQNLNRSDEGELPDRGLISREAVLEEAKRRGFYPRINRINDSSRSSNSARYSSLTLPIRNVSCQIWAFFRRLFS
jgi:hypothetical protein